MSKGSPRVLVAISDLHCGSTYGMLPPEFVTLEQNPVRQNPLQVWLWEAWTRLWSTFFSRVGDDDWILVVNGDVIEGKHHGGGEIISVDEADHLEAAYQVLSPLAQKAAATFVVEGTQCHTKNNEHALAKLLKAVPDASNNTPAWRKLQMVMCGVPLVAQHHIGATSRVWLESGEPGRALANEQLEALRCGDRIAQILISSHRHRWFIGQAQSSLTVVTPAWQGITRYGRKVVPSARLVVGMIVLDWRTVADGEIPHVWRLTQSTAQPSWWNFFDTCQSQKAKADGQDTKSNKESGNRKPKRCR